MTTHETTSYQPAERWPFQPGEAVYYEPSNHSMTRPYISELAKATVVSCRDNRISIQREDKSKVSTVDARNLSYRGYCPHCEQPAVALPNKSLICPMCDKPALAEPLPDLLALRLFPRDSWKTPMTVRRAFDNPTWPFWSVRDAVSELVEAAYKGMLERFQLKELRPRNEHDWVRHYNGERLLEFYAVLGDEAGFQATYRDLEEYANKPSAALREIMQSLFGDELPAPRAVVVNLPPLPERIADDSEPDGADDLTRWLECQFKRTP